MTRLFNMQSDVEGEGSEEDMYWFEYMIGVQGNYMYSWKIVDGVAMFRDPNGDWIEDRDFPYQKYDRWMKEKLEEALDLEE